MVKKIILILLLIFAAIQLIRPEKNNGSAQTPNDITQVVSVPQQTLQLLQTACYDCHSNHTKYPWYSTVQPIGLWLSSHINEGKKELNFSEFKTYNAKKMDHKLEEVAETVENHNMPIKTYLWIHDEARLTDAQRQTLIAWSKAARQQINYKP